VSLVPDRSAGEASPRSWGDLVVMSGGWQLGAMISLADPVAELAVFGVLILALALFVAGPWRYDLVALGVALMLALVGVIPADRLFTGFAHPAVITVAAVLVVSRGLQASGLVQIISGWVVRIGDRTTLQVAALSLMVAVCSAFMNNVGALAIFLPVAVRLARKCGQPPSVLLMPLAFASLLGGMTTLIGTPPNIIIASFRAEDGAMAFQMFDFAPVGVGVTVAGILFISLVGWRLLPERTGGGAEEDLFQIQEYLTEIRVPEDSSVEGDTLRKVEEEVEGGFLVVALIRNGRKLPAPSPWEVLQAGDILLVEAGSEALEELADGSRFALEGERELDQEALKSEEVSLLEVVVRPDSPLVGRSAASTNLRWRHGANLLALARRGERLTRRLGHVKLEAGDVLLLQVRSERVQETLSAMGCLPLAERDLKVGRPRRLILGVGLFGIAMILTATGQLPVTVAFTGAALAMVLFNLVPLRELYTSVDWPVIVLLGAMIPVGEALETTGGADRIAGYILMLGDQLPAAGTLAVVMVGTMFLSDLVNNAAAVVLMAPIAITVSLGLGVSADPFLMAVAVGGSSAFLTPIGHQSNVLVMNPGGYRFGDYWRMGLPLEVLTVLVGIPLILTFWPL
jgi:di/tricarboxylate transporter